MRIVVSTIILVLIVSSNVSVTWAQSSIPENPQDLVRGFDDVIFKWDLLSADMRTYEGLAKYCTDAEFQANVNDVLGAIHHYDSLLYERISKKARFSKDHEIKKTLQQIQEFEEEYKAASFLRKLRDECRGRGEIERGYDETRNDIGEYSYDGQVTILEADLNKYVTHITKLVDHIKKHIHHLHLE